MVWIDETRDGMDPRHLERVFLFEGRQDPRQPAGEHGLARAGWAAEQQVVTAGGRQLECTSPSFLAANVGKIERPPPRLAVAYDVLRRLELPAEIRDRIREVAHSDRLDSCQGGLGTRFVRTDDALQVGATRTLSDGKHAADTAQAPVKCKLSARRVFSETRARELV
jgi:hypothetical protein